MFASLNPKARAWYRHVVACNAWKGDGKKWRAVARRQARALQRGQ